MLPTKGIIIDYGPQENKNSVRRQALNILLDHNLLTMPSYINNYYNNFKTT